MIFFIEFETNYFIKRWLLIIFWWLLSRSLAYISLVAYTYMFDYIYFYIVTAAEIQWTKIQNYWSDQLNFMNHKSEILTFLK